MKIKVGIGRKTTILKIANIPMKKVVYVGRQTKISDFVRYYRHDSKRL